VLVINLTGKKFGISFRKGPKSFGRCKCTPILPENKKKVMGDGRWAIGAGERSREKFMGDGRWVIGTGARSRAIEEL
jgi:hypothetical protein